MLQSISVSLPRTNLKRDHLGNTASQNYAHFPSADTFHLNNINSSHLLALLGIPSKEVPKNWEAVKLMGADKSFSFFNFCLKAQILASVTISKSCSWFTSQKMSTKYPAANTCRLSATWKITSKSHSTRRGASLIYSLNCTPAVPQTGPGPPCGRHASLPIPHEEPRTSTRGWSLRKLCESTLTEK